MLGVWPMTPVPCEVAYLGACALGLAYGPAAGKDPVAELVCAADGDPARLRMAHEAVLSSSAVDRETRQRAARMLVAAARTLELSPAAMQD